MTIPARNRGYATVYDSDHDREVIVIDDSFTPPIDQQPPDTPQSSYSSAQQDLPPAASTRSKRTILREPSPPPKKRKKTQARSRVDDKHGHLIYKPNGDITKRFKMMRLLGQGTFGKVIECYDRLKRTRCAIKVIRSIKKYRDASSIEMRVLKTLHEHDPLNNYQCIHLSEWFEHEQHVCMVFELLGPSLFDFLKSNRFEPFPLDQIQHFALQLLISVKFLHGLKLIHTDLKPENILMINRPKKECTEIRLIDFGSATFENEFHSPIVSTRHYRAPEIILATGWSYPCDLWSIGCILVEFCTGQPLFQTHDNLEHLAMMQAVLGKFPSALSSRSIFNGEHYFRKSQLLYPTKETSQERIKFVKAMQPLRKLVPPSQSPGHALLLDLLEKIFVFDPRLRITATDALKHPFLHYTL